MSELPIVFYFLLFIVAFLYASVGHGGASGYLALMALFSVAPESMRTSALILNIFVSVAAFISYYRNGNFNWRLFGLLAIGSVPAAFMGGMIKTDPFIYKKILGILLLFPIVRFIGFQPDESEKLKTVNVYYALLLGVIIGFLSGLIGIGGGIILTPVLLLLAWTNVKDAAGISALFITVNSIAGLLGTSFVGVSVDSGILWFVVIGVAGGSLGAYVGSNYFSGKVLRKLLAVVLMIACAKLLFT